VNDCGSRQDPFSFVHSFVHSFVVMGVWKGMAMDSLKFYPGLPCPSFPCPASGPPTVCDMLRHRGFYRSDDEGKSKTCQRHAVASERMQGLSVYHILLVCLSCLSVSSVPLFSSVSSFSSVGQSHLPRLSISPVCLVHLVCLVRLVCWSVCFVCLTRLDCLTRLVCLTHLVCLSGLSDSSGLSVESVSSICLGCLSVLLTGTRSVLAVQLYL
jgi:hypothetical protein